MGKDLKGRELGKCLSQRKDGRYQARFTNRYGQRIEYKDKNFNNVKEWLKEEKAKDDLKINVKNCNDTLDTWYYKWKEIAFVDLALNTQEQYERNYRNIIRPELGNMKVTDINEYVARSFLQGLKKFYKYKTIISIQHVLKQILQCCKDARCIVYNPMKEVKIKKQKKQTLVDDNVRALTKMEQKLVFDYLEDHFYYNFFVFLLTTGLRFGEAAALTKDDIDISKKVVYVTKALKRNKINNRYQFYIGPPKTEFSIRIVPLNNIAIEAIKRQILLKQQVEKSVYRDSNVHPELKNLLFVSQRNTPVVNRNVNVILHNARDRINCQFDCNDYIKPFTVHSLRHTFATRCYEAGIPMKVISKYLGHSSVTVTENIYVHLLKDHLKSEGDKLNDAYKQQDIQIEDSLLNLECK